jgi:hypothetical protein
MTRASCKASSYHACKADHKVGRAIAVEQRQFLGSQRPLLRCALFLLALLLYGCMVVLDPIAAEFTLAPALHVELLLALPLSQVLLKPLSFTLLPTIHLPPAGKAMR